MLFRRLFCNKRPSHKNFQEITPQELQRKLQADEPLIIIDVRSAQEYASYGYLAGARLLPLATLRYRSDELPKDRPIVCICRSGMRSRVACEQLADLGFVYLFNLNGGLLKWQQADLPIQF